MKRTRTTIDFGISLGRVNSAVAVLNDGKVDVIKNNDGNVLTPSAIWISKKGNVYVGQRARGRLELDPENACTDFLLQMGTDTVFEFRDSGRSMRAEELAAAVLKSLIADVKHMLGEEVRAAVITVPAAFELPQIEATKRAAELAGLMNSPLLQEPIAAALAYGFQAKGDKAYRLVYDFRGDTFDASVLQVKDGEITVVNHVGDNHLGGKLIDWEIVDKIFTPELLKNYDLSDFKRGNPKWRTAFAKLKKIAEEAKIRLSRTDSEEIIVSDLGKDNSGEAIDLDLVLERSKLEELARPFIVRSVNMCRRALKEKRLSPGDIEKVVLVGGTTLIPYVREVLSNPGDGLGIPLDFSIDPLTVVARGAAIFAGAQQLKVDLENLSGDQYALQLDYEPVGTEELFDVGGKINGPAQRDFSSFSIEFIEQGRDDWRSGKIPVNAQGAFITELRAFEGRKNTYLIELLDGQGIPQETVPQSISYTFGMTISAPPLVHSVGVALANNEVDFFFEKDTPLPVRMTKGFKIAHEAKPWQKEPILRLPIIEGENRRRADRNMLVGYLHIPGDMIHLPLPAGSVVEITIDISESRIFKAAAFIPDLGIEVEVVIRPGRESWDIEQLKEEFEHEKERWNSLKEQVEAVDDFALFEALVRIEEENMMEELEKALAESGRDKDAPDKIKRRLLEVQEAIDEIEDKANWLLWPEEAEDERDRRGALLETQDSSLDAELPGNTSLEELRASVLEGNADLNVIRNLAKADGANSLKCFVRDRITLLGLGDDLRGNRWVVHPGKACVFVQVKLDNGSKEFLFDAATTLLWDNSGISAHPFGVIFLGDFQPENPVVVATDLAGARSVEGQELRQYGLAAILPGHTIPSFIFINEKMYHLELVNEAVALRPAKFTMSFTTDISIGTDIVHADRIHALDGWDTFSVPLNDSGVVAQRLLWEPEFTFDRSKGTTLIVYRANHPDAPKGVTIDTNHIRAITRDGKSHNALGIMIWWTGPVERDLRGAQFMHGKLGLSSHGINKLFGGLSFAPRKNYTGPFSVSGRWASKLVLAFPHGIYGQVSSVELGEGFAATGSAVD